MPISSVYGSPLVTGRWEGDTFINDWTGITFTLPSGFWAETDLEFIRGEYASDVLLFHYDHPEIVFSLSYFDVTQGERREHTAEDYLNISRRALEDSTGRDFFFNDFFESATIAGREYARMSGTFVNVGDNAQTIYNIDRHAYRWVGTMLVIVTMYADENADMVNDFLASIKSTQ